MTIRGRGGVASSITISKFATDRAAYLYVKSTEKTIDENDDVSEWIRCEWIEDWRTYELKPRTQRGFAATIGELYDRDVQRVLFNVDTKTLAAALKNTTSETQDKIFHALSKRAIDYLKEDMENMGPIPLSECIEAQATILTIVERLRENEEISAEGEELVV